MRLASPLLCPSLLLLILAAQGCGKDDDTGEPAPARPIGEYTFGAFESWSSPIEDYKAVGEEELPGQYDASVNELFAFGGRLWMGYGDGTYNMGTYTPIEFRYFQGAQDPEPEAARVEGDRGAEQTVPTQSGDEVIGSFREVDGDLWQAGLDSTNADEAWTMALEEPKIIEGNMYSLPAASQALTAEEVTWTKHRTVPGGEHVQDVAGWQGAVWGVGSGADYRTEFEAGEIFRYLWVSTDAGGSFTTVERIQHPVAGGGDTRWVYLLPMSDALYLFGYESDFAEGSAAVRNAVYSGGEATAQVEGTLENIFAMGTLALPDGTGLVWGVRTSGLSYSYVLWHVLPGGEVEVVDLGDQRPLDLALYADTDEILILAAPGAEYPGDTPESWELSVLLAPADDPGAWGEIATTTSPVYAGAIAWWQESLFLGTSDGQVQKAAGTGG